MESRPSGNYCTFSMFLLCNLALLGVGIAVATLAIYICADQDDFSWYDGLFALLGFVIVLTAIASIKTKDSLKWLFVYMLFLLILTAIVGGLTLGLIFWHDFEIKIGYENAWGVRGSYIGSCAAMLFCVVVGFFYRKSLINAVERKSEEVNFTDIKGPLVSPRAGKPETISKGFQQQKPSKKSGKPESLFEMK
ncbi:unnamed protein product [Blepharisma stoltei]|uniref:Uncharacterized protein n=1 Tax=Blepharisma stoltei TaxID=1481888 RepID=A0AAU9J0L8_9CILI|nr:unnamed protein product [Blepharisma stoltei]